MAAIEGSRLIPNRLPAYRDQAVTVYCGDVREVLSQLSPASVDCCVTSPPYWGLRDYGIPAQLWDGDPACRHRSAEEDGGCRHCGAWRGHLGLEPTPDLYVKHMVEIFSEVRRVLKPFGSLWLNLGDCYNAGTTAIRKPSPNRVGYWQTAGSIGDRRVNASGLKPKDLVGIPWRVALALQANGWYLRADVIWAKPNPIPESVTDRPTRAHEYLFLLSPSARYFYDAEAIREPCQSGPSDISNMSAPLPRIGGKHSHLEDAFGAASGRTKIGCLRPVGDPYGRNKRSVWTIPTQPYRGAHFATFPERLVEPCIMAGTSEAGCCSACGEPWVRIVEVAYVNPGSRSSNGPRSLERRRESPGYPVRLERSSATRGWRPGCGCNATRVPAVVLDPFAGSGTTLAVAKRLGRSGWGVELSSQYVALIGKRCASERQEELAG